MRSVDIIKKIFSISRGRPFRVVAIIAARNEEIYMERVLCHLIEQGVEVYVIDNESTDSTREIVSSFLGKGVIHMESFPYPGYFDWEKILTRKSEIAREIDADWFMHQDPDEIREAPRPFLKLRDAFEYVDGKGFNAVNFDEFTFIPSSPDESFVGKDYVALMKYYYHFAPSPLRRVNAWKKNDTAALEKYGGHHIGIENLRLFPQNFILRHYIGLDQNYLIQKYMRRIYSKELVEKKGWHGRRATIRPEEIVLPPRKILKLYTFDGKWDRSDPWKQHYFLHNGERYK